LVYCEDWFCFEIGGFEIGGFDCFEGEFDCLAWRNLNLLGIPYYLYSPSKLGNNSLIFQLMDSKIQFKRFLKRYATRGGEIFRRRKNERKTQKGMDKRY